MAGETTSAILANFITTAVSRNVIQEARDSAVIVRLVRSEDLQGAPAKTISIPYWPSMAAADLTEGTDASPASIRPGAYTITADEAGIAFEITDLAAESDIFSGLGQYSSFGARAMVEKIDNDLGALFSALNSGTAVGTTTANMTEKDFIDAITELELNRAPQPYYCVLHPRQWADVRDNLASTTAVMWGGGTTLQEELLRTARVASPFGVQTFTTTQLATANSGGDWVGAMFSRESLGIAWKWRVRTEFDRNALGRSTYLVITAAYGVGELVDLYGVPIITDYGV